jgi:Family of unknown function (DUF6527)
MAGRMKVAWHQWLPFRRWRLIGEVESADEVPDLLPRNSAVLVGTPDFPKWIVFDCACRANHRIMLNLDSSRKPNWALVNRERLTIRPSIDYEDSAKRCHYFLRAGKTVWARDTYR